MDKTTQQRPAPDSSPTPPPTKQGQTSAATRPGAQWQRKLRPWMVVFVTLLAAFFLVDSYYQIRSLRERIDAGPRMSVAELLAMIDSAASQVDSYDRLTYTRWLSLVAMDAQALERRYHQANVGLMTRTWTSYLGFMTGMILALVGAAFVLGKLREDTSTLDAEATSLWKISVTTASPGLVLAILGTAMMITTMLTHRDIRVTDAAVFTALMAPAVEAGPGMQTRPLIPECEPGDPLCPEAGGVVR